MIVTSKSLNMAWDCVLILLDHKQYEVYFPREVRVSLVGWSFSYTHIHPRNWDPISEKSAVELD
jgi:hypothetical protein